MKPNYYVVCDDAHPAGLRIFDAEGRELPGVRSVKWECGRDQIGTATVEFVKVALGPPDPARAELQEAIDRDTVRLHQSILDGWRAEGCEVDVTAAGRAGGLT
jgi:hypothetical protein